MQIAFAGRIGYTLQLSVRANFSRGPAETRGSSHGRTDALKSDIDFAVVKPNVKLSISNYTLSRSRGRKQGGRFPLAP